MNYKSEKVYIGKVEAFELCLEYGFVKLPRKGMEHIKVRSRMENSIGINNEIIGKDEKGYYITSI